MTEGTGGEYELTRYDNGETNLHCAIESGNFAKVEKLLSIHQDFDIRCVTKKGNLLNYAARGGSPEIASLLIEIGVPLDHEKTPRKEIKEDINGDERYCVQACCSWLCRKDDEVKTNKDEESVKSPLQEAVDFGYVDVALTILKGREVNGKTELPDVPPHVFRKIAEKGYKKLAEATVEREDWKEIMRGGMKQKQKWSKLSCKKEWDTPFRHLIRNLPDVAKTVLDKCVPEGAWKDNPEGDHYQVAYNYEFVDDFRKSYDKKFKEDEDKEDPSYDDEYLSVISNRKRWGPVYFSKQNHPLSLMVRHKRDSLLYHPVTLALIDLKWRKLGWQSYITNLMFYILFLTFLTSFALVVPNPQTRSCADVYTNSSLRNGSLTCAETDVSRRLFPSVVAAFVILLALLRLIQEFCQLLIKRLRYFFDFSNWIEIVLFVCSIIFAVMPNWTCPCVFNWQWQVGVVAVFLAWCDFISYTSNFPFVGIYVIMFTKICKTFLKLALLTFLLVITFGITFYMIFSDSTVTRSPFSSEIRSMIRTLMMTTGEMDYDGIFRLGLDDGSNDATELSYLPVAYIVWIPFVILMPVLFANMLTGLAVGDADTVLKDAESRLLSQTIDQVLSVEEFWINIRFTGCCFSCLLCFSESKWFKILCGCLELRKTHKKFTPNTRKKHWRRRFRNWLEEFIGVDLHRFDTLKVVNEVKRPEQDKTDQILEETTKLKEQFNDVLEKMEKLSAAICKKKIDHFQERVEEVDSEEDSVQTPPLLAACNGGHTEIASWLIEETGADVDETDNLGRTPLLAACEGGHTDCVRLLVDKNINADLNKQAKDGTSPLLAACKSGHTEAVQLLINKSEVDVNKPDNNGISPLHAACEGGYVDIVEELISNRRVVQDIDRGDKFETSPLLAVCEGGDTGVDSEGANCRERTKIAQMLIEAGADVNKVNQFKRTALLAACERGHKGIARLLINCAKRQNVVRSTTISTV